MRRLPFVLACALAWASLVSVAAAQPPRGEVAGLEMSLEGALSAPRGRTLRWLVTAYEVLGLSELRPAVGTTVHVATSLDRTEEAVSVTTDANGRALIDLAIPDDADDSFAVVLRLVSPGGVQRRFELSVRVTAPEAIEVHVARPIVAPGGTLRTFGRLTEERTGQAIADRIVHVTLRDRQSRPLAPPAQVRTDRAGLFAHAFTVPDDALGTLVIEARTDDDEHPVRAHASSMAGEIGAQPMLVAVAPERWVLAPRERVGLEVVVRTGNGRPVEGAVVTLPGAEREDTDRRATTDARGRARLAYDVPGYTSGIHDVGILVSATREGLGSASGAATVRIAASAHAAGIAVEGGALVPSLGGRVWVRVLDAEGRPAGAGIEVEAQGPRLGAAGARATTDADGVATLDLALRAGADATADRCGGQTATALEVRVGSGAESTTLTPCIPLDPDGAARVRVARPVVRTGEPVEVTIERVAAAARAPVEVSLLRRVAGRPPEAVGTALLAAGESSASITPSATSGELWVVARARIGATHQIVRGGVSAVWVVPGAPARVAAELAPSGVTTVRFDGATGDRSTYVVAMSIDEARQLAERLRAAFAPLGDLRRDPGGASPSLLFAALAARVPPDVAAPFVLRGGDVIAVPAPAQPEQEGLLRDPWRARSRFVTGRLALIYRALEEYVAAALPERVDDVAVQGPRGFTFNAQILDSVAASGNLGAAGATGLGGEPLTIEQLQRFDPSLTYDNVARRITRERLFRLILALRQLVNQQGWDLAWSRLGDPATWIRSLMHQYVPGGTAISQRDMVDGWGRPFTLRQARGTSRFGFINPLGTWEIVSMGPDGRIATGDDVWDPTARVVRSGTPYAEAVGEDVLVARLSGVELGRASVELLRNVEPQASAGRVPPQSSEPARRLAQQLWESVPSLFTPPPEPLALRRPAHPGDGAGGRLTRLDASGGEVALTLDEEPRTWGALVWAWTDEGWGAVDVGAALAGAPIIVEAAVPDRLRSGEPVELDLVLTNVTDAPLALSLGTDGTSVAVEGPGTLTLGAGAAGEATLRLAPAQTPGRGDVRLTFRADGAAVRSMRWPVRLVSGDHPLRLRAAGLVRARPFQVRFTVPEDARRAAGRVIVLAPSALAADPDLADLREHDPALVAFSDALAGRASDPALAARLLRAQQPDGHVEGQDPLLSSAAAAVAWASAGEHDEDAQRALARVRAGFLQAGGPIELGDPGALRTGAAVLGALSAGGVPELSVASERANDPILRVAAMLRQALRRALRTHPEEPTLLARAAGALLLADPRDAYGLAMLERASAHLADAPDAGALVVPSSRMDSALEALGATLALAVAAHQAGQGELRDRLVRGALGRDHVALRAGGETAFWLLAAGTYGALGRDASSVIVHVDGQRHEASLEGGRAVIALSPRAGGHEVRAEAGEGSAFVRVEAAMERPFVARDGGPLSVRLDGEPGDAGTLAALELTITARGEVDAPVLDVSLPAGVEVDDRLRQSLEGTSGVRSVEARSPGFVRVRLEPMADGTERTIPLPLRWTVRGTLRGLGAVAYPLGRPEAMSAIAPRQLRIDPAPRLR